MTSSVVQLSARRASGTARRAPAAATWAFDGRQAAEADQAAPVVACGANLDHGCDTKLAAEALLLHRASLSHRLQRIDELTGASLKSGAIASHGTSG